MKQSVVVSRLDLTDLKSLYECRLRALKNSPTAFLTTYEETQENGFEAFAERFKANDDSNSVYVGKDGDQIVAMAGIHQQSRPKLKHKAYIWGVYVDKSYRGQGLGTQLIEQLVVHAREKMTVTSVYLSVEETNSSAKNLYERLGFRVWGTEPRAMYDAKNYYDETHLVLHL